jgi:hypothetical protein
VHAAEDLDHVGRLVVRIAADESRPGGTTLPSILDRERHLAIRARERVLGTGIVPWSTNARCSLRELQTATWLPEPALELSRPPSSALEEPRPDPAPPPHPDANASSAAAIVLARASVAASRYPRYCIRAEREARPTLASCDIP